MELKKLREKSNIEICEKENKLPFTYLTNVIDENLTKKKVKATLEIIAKTLCGTLGPYGATTIIQERDGNHSYSKDGFDLIKSMSFDDSAAQVVLQIIKNVAKNQVLKVGDGSTSAIIVANSIYNAINTNDYLKNVAPKDIVDILNFISDEMTEILKTSAIPVSEDFKEIKTLASIATNNDEKVGDIIEKIYNKIGVYGFIDRDVITPYDEDNIEFKKGISWNRGYYDTYFANGKADKKVIYENGPDIFLYNGSFTYEDCADFIQDLLGFSCFVEKHQLLIVTNGMDSDVETFLKYNRLKHLRLENRGTLEADFTVVDIDKVTATGRNTLEDLSILTGATIFDKNKYDTREIRDNPESLKKFLGTAEKITVSENETQIITSDGDLTEEQLQYKKDFVKDLLNKIKTTENEVAQLETSPKILYDLRKRLSHFRSSVALYHVGGGSLAERRSRERLIEDAILSTKSAIKYGYIPGGNLMIPKMLETHREELVKKMLEKFYYIQSDNLKEFFNNFISSLKIAFLESYRHVLENNSAFTEENIDDILNTCLTESKFYNLKKHTYEAFNETSVINSVDTDIQIMKSCVSIIGLLATSNQMVTLNFNPNDLRQ